MDRFTGLEVFVHVVDDGGFTPAAEKLGLSRAAVSKHVQQLEDRLGSRLLNRTTRRVSLTEVGAAYYERATRILSELEEADNAVTRFQSEPRGTLRVTAPQSLGQLYLGHAVADFLALYPQLSIHMMLSDRYIDLIEEGYDLAIRIGQLPDSSLVAHRIVPLQRFLVASPDYLKRRGTPNTARDLDNHPRLLYSLMRSGNEWQLSGPDGDYTVKSPEIFTTNNGEVLCQAAQAGLGITMLPTFITAPYLVDGSLEIVLPQWAPPEFGMFVVYSSGRYVPPKVRSFIDFLVARFGPVPEWDRALRNVRGAAARER